MDIKELILFEDKLIYQEAVSAIASDDPFSPISSDALDIANKQISSIAARLHQEVLLRLISHYLSSRFSNASDIMRICFDCDLIQSSDLSISDFSIIPSLCEQLHISFLNSKFSIGAKGSKVRSKSKEQLIELGAVYTQSHVAKNIVDNTLANMSTALDSAAKILDFACGTGRFYENIIPLFEDKKRAVLFNVYAIDIDLNALLVTRLKALSFIDAISADECKTLCNHIVLKDGLRKNNTIFPNPMHISYDDLDGLTESGFDAIVSNPPYLVLKPNRSKAAVRGSDKIQKQVTYFRTCGFYHYSIEGMLNLYQLSIERMLQMLKPGGKLGIICPSTLFGDVSASRLRKYLLLHNNVRTIRFYAEKIPLFENVNQATNIFILRKGGKTSTITISEEDDVFDVNISLVQELFPENLEIPTIKSLEWEILRKLSSMKKLKQISTVRNRRGELDLTLCKDFVTTDKTPYRLVRGNMIGESGVKDINGEFVLESFIPTRSNDYRRFDFNRKRLICQQISNGGLRRRLKFIYCTAFDILGNSCNYISSDEETLAKLYLVLNSSVLNWRFKITSSNNHINNYELDELPIIDLEKIDPAFSYSSQEELDEYIGSLYGLSKEERNIIAI
ncbi:MAG: N-6 DNA methylase [Muribaculaceae bacterium]|nr:N-6 DNA methylase [Muribaculaceae bacterium]